MKQFAAKLLVASLVGLLLLIAGGLLRSVVEDRLAHREAARSSITESLAGAQTLAGVTLVLPYVEHYEQEVEGENGKPPRRVAQQKVHQLEVLPERSDFNGQLISDPRYRGLFRVNGYLLTGRLSGELQIPEATQLPRLRPDSRLEFSTARLIVAISDPRGLRKLEARLGDRNRPVEAGTGQGSDRPGAHAPIHDAAALLGRNINYDVALELVGTDALSMVPLGRENTAQIESPWPHPSFGGRFLPVERSVRESGFSASWRISSLASTARDAWLTQRSGVDSFSVALIDPVDIYVMADRASKYAALFVALTLGAFILLELLRSLRLHAMHYLLIGAALLIFFLLLLGLAERLGFAAAYGLAGSACVILIGGYIGPLLRNRWLTLSFTGGLASLYGALYVILLSEQNALLMGSLLIFALLGAVMIGTRNVDWHALLSERRLPPADEA